MGTWSVKWSKILCASGLREQRWGKDATSRGQRTQLGHGTLSGAVALFNQFDLTHCFGRALLCLQWTSLVYPSYFWSLCSWSAWPSFPSFLHLEVTLFFLLRNSWSASHDVFLSLKQVILDALKKSFKFDLLFVAASSCLLQSCSAALLFNTISCCFAGDLLKDVENWIGSQQ